MNITKVDGGKCGLCIENYRLLRNAESGGKSSSEMSTLIGYQYQMVSPENIHTSNTIKTEKVIFRNICICIRIYI